MLSMACAPLSDVSGVSSNHSIFMGMAQNKRATVMQVLVLVPFTKVPFCYHLLDMFYILG